MLSTILSFVWIALPLGAWTANLCTGKRIHPALLYVATGLAGYFVLLAAVWALDAQLEAKMNSFDLDEDGSFSGPELTPEAELAMDEWASDTGRTFAPIFGIPMTAIWYTILFAVVFGGEWIFGLVFRRKRVPLPAEAPHSGNLEQPKSDNPYQPPNVG